MRRLLGRMLGRGWDCDGVDLEWFCVWHGMALGRVKTTLDGIGGML